MATPRQLFLLAKLTIIAGVAIIGATMNDKSGSATPSYSNNNFQKVDGYEGRYQVSENNELLAKAKAEAMKMLPNFFKRFESGKENKDEFALLVRFHSGRSVDYMWVVKLEKLSATRYRGILESSSLRVPELSAGKPVGFDTKNITDWAIGFGDNMEGAYTEKALKKLAAKG